MEIDKAIRKALSEGIQHIVEEEAREAGRRAELRVRAMAGEAAISIARHVNYDYSPDKLIITVHIPEKIQ